MSFLAFALSVLSHPTGGRWGGERAKLYGHLAVGQDQPTIVLYKGTENSSIGQVIRLVSQEDASLFADVFFLMGQKAVWMII